ITRVSPPELARELPGPQASTSVTRAPWRRRNSAVQPPNAPAPITAMCGCLAVGITTPPPSATAALVLRNERRPTVGEPRAPRDAPFPAPTLGAPDPRGRRRHRPGSHPRRPGPTTSGECSLPWAQCRWLAQRRLPAWKGVERRGRRRLHGHEVALPARRSMP